MIRKRSMRADTVVRVPRELIERAARLVPHLESDQELQLVGRGITTAAVVRLAIMHGLQMMEDEAGAAMEAPEPRAEREPVAPRSASGRAFPL